MTRKKVVGEENLVSQYKKKYLSSITYDAGCTRFKLVPETGSRGYEKRQESDVKIARLVKLKVRSAHICGTHATRAVIGEKSRVS